MKRIIIGIIAIILISDVVHAQQDAMYSQYMFNTLAINPAYAGSRNVLSATALYRTQWTGIAGAPRTATFTMDAPINNKRIGLGFQLFNDKLGITNTTGAVLSYAYRIRMDRGTLSFGLQGSASQYKADYSSVALQSTGISDDPAFRDNINKVLFNVGTGVYYNSDKFYVGLSSPELLANKLNDRTSSDTAVAKRSFHIFLASGYVFPVAEDFKLKPSVLFKAVKGAPMEADVNLTLWIKDAIGIGAQYRTSADVSALVEFQASPQIRIGYAYDRSITRLQSYNTGSHEIMLRYEFGFDRGKILSPRFF